MCVVNKEMCNKLRQMQLLECFAGVPFVLYINCRYVCVCVCFVYIHGMDERM